MPEIPSLKCCGNVSATSQIRTCSWRSPRSKHHTVSRAVSGETGLSSAKCSVNISSVGVWYMGVREWVCCQGRVLSQPAAVLYLGPFLGNFAGAKCIFSCWVIYRDPVMWSRTCRGKRRPQQGALVIGGTVKTNTKQTTNQRFCLNSHKRRGGMV